MFEKIKGLRKSLQTTNLKKACQAAADFLEWLQKDSQVLVDGWRGQYERHGTVTPFVQGIVRGYPPGTLDALSDLLIQLVQLTIAKKPGFKDEALELSGKFLRLSGVSHKARTKRRRQSAARKPTPLTAKQAEAMHLVGEHKGNFAAAGRAAGKSRQAMQKLYNKALRKLGKSAVKTYTNRLPTE
jgi:predicted DNA-binding protein (UPF0251 family)